MKSNASFSMSWPKLNPFQLIVSSLANHYIKPNSVKLQLLLTLGLLFLTRLQSAALVSYRKPKLLSSSMILI